MAPSQERARLAFERLGFESLHPGQLEAISHVLDGRDMLAIMRTGSGNSAIYQIPAVLIPGTTVVIRLQKDQVDTLRQHGAPLVNSATRVREKHAGRTR